MFACADHIHCIFTLISSIFARVYNTFFWSLVFFTVYSHGSTLESMAYHGIKWTYINLYICVAGRRLSNSNEFILFLLWLLHYPALSIYLLVCLRSCRKNNWNNCQPFKYCCYLYHIGSISFHSYIFCSKTSGHTIGYLCVHFPGMDCNPHQWYHGIKGIATPPDDEEGDPWTLDATSPSLKIIYFIHGYYFTVAKTVKRCWVMFVLPIPWPAK